MLQTWNYLGYFIARALQFLDPLPVVLLKQKSPVAVILELILMKLSHLWILQLKADGAIQQSIIKSGSELALMTLCGCPAFSID